MVTKAKIDLLDIDIQSIQETSPASEDNLQAPGTDKKTGWIGVLLRRLKKHKLIFIIGLSLFLFAVVGASVWLYFINEGKKETIIEEKETVKTPALAAGQAVMFDHFVVNIRDQKGEIRIVVCDVFVEMENPKVALAEDERVQIRRSIYTALQKKAIDNIFSVEVRNNIRVEIKTELERLIGEKTVKNIYITRFEVI